MNVKSSTSPSLSPFWEKEIQSLSNTLWSPEGKDCREERNYKHVRIPRSWFKVKIKQSLQQLSVVEYHIVQALVDATGLKTSKHCIRPSADEIATLKRWIYGYRMIYNECVRLYNEDPTIKHGDMMKRVATSTEQFLRDNPDLSKIPAAIRQYAVIDFRTALKAAKSNLKANNIDHFEMKPKNMTRSQRYHVVTIRHVDWNRKRGIFSFLNRLLPNITVEHDCKILCDTFLKKWYLLNPVSLAPQNHARHPDSVVSIDPGCRTPLSCYDHIHKCTIEIGSEMYTRIEALNACIDKTKSFLDTLHVSEGKRVRPSRLRHSMHKRWTKIRNLLDEYIKKTVIFLLSNYKTVVIPDLNASEFYSKTAKPVRKRMLKLSHYRFLQYLKFKASEYDSTIVIQEESYTSKTCSSCGWYNSELGDSKVFECETCKRTFDRDSNAAKNIYLKYRSSLGR